MEIILVVLLVLVVLALPRWSFSSGWGYGPSGVFFVVLVILLVLLLTGRIP